ncbi:MAG TPA: type II toxin-antitoxin system VapC family toxin [Candidatus Sulfotelmatobacter sp.]|jgi:predicted nucleic acid-binding protein|nr:type II toxin-antitoxin system VapC family toxin [Candidatus Sulfotelmatobacter sp.]
MAETFNAIPAGSNLLLDANVFVYGLTAQSAECRSLLERCSTEEIFGITLFEIIHEATHVFMLAEAKAKSLFTSTEKGAKYLARHPNDVKNLSDYWTNAQRLLSLNVLILQMEQDIVVEAHTERVNAGLLTNDSIIVAAMREYGISRIATNDAQFDTVAGISVYSPTDVP